MRFNDASCSAGGSHIFRMLYGLRFFSETVIARVVLAFSSVRDAARDASNPCLKGEREAGRG